MGDFKEDDEVEFTLRGRVVAVSYDADRGYAYIAYEDVDGDKQTARYVPIAAVRLISRPVREGDTVAPDTPDLPVGSVLVDSAAGGVLVRYQHGWGSGTSLRCGWAEAKRLGWLGATVRVLGVEK